MNVLIVKSFVDKIDGEKYRMVEGQEVQLPAGANWLDVGFAVPVRGQARETAAVEPEERAVKPAAKKRQTRKRAKPKKGVMSTKSMEG
jgi:hypothetical protein